MVGVRVGVGARVGASVGVDVGVAGNDFAVAEGVAFAGMPATVTVGQGDPLGLIVNVCVGAIVTVREAVAASFGEGVRVGGPNGTNVGSKVSVGTGLSSRTVAVGVGVIVAVDVAVSDGGIKGVSVAAATRPRSLGSRMIAPMPRQYRAATPRKTTNSAVCSALGWLAIRLYHRHNRLKLTHLDEPYERGPGLSCAARATADPLASGNAGPPH